MADPILVVTSVVQNSQLVVEADGTKKTVTTTTIGLSLKQTSPMHGAVLSFQTDTPEQYQIGAEFTLAAVVA